MKREQAETLLARLIFDELEELLKGELLEYLKEDPELSEQLGDMRVTMQLLRDGVTAVEGPKLSPDRREALMAQLSNDAGASSSTAGKKRSIWSTLLSMRTIGAAAAVLAIGVCISALFLPSLGRSRELAKRSVSAANMRSLQMARAIEESAGNNPDDVVAMIESGSVVPKLLVSPDDDAKVPDNFRAMSRDEKRQWVREKGSYVFGLSSEGKNDDIVGFEKLQDGRGGANVAFADGHVEYIRKEELERQIRDQIEKSVAEVTKEYTNGRLNLGNVASPRDGHLKALGYLGPVSGDDQELNESTDFRGGRELARTNGGGMSGAEGDRSEIGLRTKFRFQPAAPDTRANDLSLNHSAQGERAKDFRRYATGDSKTNVSQRGAETRFGASIGGGPAPAPEREGELHDFSQGQTTLNGKHAADQNYRSGYSISVANQSKQRAGGTVVQGRPSEEPAAQPLLGGSPGLWQNDNGDHYRRQPLQADEALGDIDGDAAGTAIEGWYGVGGVASSTMQRPIDNIESDEENFDRDGLRSSARYKSRENRARIAQIDKLKNAQRELSDRGENKKAEMLGKKFARLENFFSEHESEPEEAAPAPLKPEGQSLEELSEVAQQADPVVIPTPRLWPVNPWVMCDVDRLSTFSIDVDTASYHIAQRYINEGFLPPVASVRMEEYVNAFDYNYPSGRQNDNVFTVYTSAAPAPFGENVTLVKVGIRGRVVGRDQMKPAHLVFVVDTSGSMDRPDRLPLVQDAIDLLVDQLGQHDRISLVTYDTRANLRLDSVATKEKVAVGNAVKSVQCGGSTNLLSGIELGYEIAARGFVPGGVNRVILCSDGVANVGSDDAEQILSQVDTYRKHGITFTSIGFGAGAYNDQLLEQLANKGDGSYLFVGSKDQAHQQFAEDMAATLPTIARNVKIQVDFNPARVRRYRLVGYENRDVADKDFRNDAIDAGEVGSGQSATALYEVELIGPQFNADDAPDLGTVFVRYENVETDEVEEISTRLENTIIQRRTPHSDPRFFLAAASAESAEIMRESEHAENSNLQQVATVMQDVCNALPLDSKARGLLDLVQRAEGLPRAQ